MPRTHDSWTPTQPIRGCVTPGPRNGRCPLCNSGRKWKHCHGAPPTQAEHDVKLFAEWQRILGAAGEPQ